MHMSPPCNVPPLNINSIYMIYSFTFIMYYLMVKGQFDLWVMGLHCDFDCNLIFFFVNSGNNPSLDLTLSESRIERTCHMWKHCEKTSEPSFWLFLGTVMKNCLTLTWEGATVFEYAMLPSAKRQLPNSQCTNAWFSWDPLVYLFRPHFLNNSVRVEPFLYLCLD